MVNNLPNDITNVLKDHSLDIDSLLDKLQNLISIVATHTTIAFNHAKELAEKDPDKAGYIFSLTLAGMLISFIFGRRSKL